MGEKYDIEIETISKPKEEYNTDEYFELDLPVAPAVMVGEEIVVEGSDVSEEELHSVIRRHLGTEPPVDKGFSGKLIKRGSIVSQR